MASSEPSNTRTSTSTLRKVQAVALSDDLLFGIRSSDAFRDMVTEVERLVPRNGNFLDLGCSNGGFIGELLRRRPDVRCTGVDISPQRVEMASQEESSATFLVADVQARLPFDDESMDTVISIEVIEHLDAPGYFLNEIYRVLRPGGDLFITTPNAGAITASALGPKWYALADPSHIHFFTALSLTHALRHKGFVVGHTETRSATGFTLLNRLLLRTAQGGQLVAFARRPQTHASSS